MSTGAEARTDGRSAHVRALERELDWLVAVLHARLANHFGQPHEPSDPRALAPPAADDDAAALVRLVRRVGLGWSERLVLALALAPHLRPQALDPLCVRNADLDRGFSEFGGWKGRLHGGFLPTGETAALLVAGEDLAARTAAMRLFDEGHPLRREDIVRLAPDAPDEPRLSAPLLVSPEWVDELATGVRRPPDFGPGFPARRLTTPLGWDDLVVGPDTRLEIDTLLGWCRHESVLMTDWGLARSLKPGYRALFHGPPGTGKTLTAALLGQALGADVYRVDLSMLVSKYIGETEKNLARVFDRAEDRGWILFFDEADALFGKRTSTSSAHDRYANQEVSYLLQRIEDYRGLVVLATNLKHNLDDAFARRFQSVVHFPMPDADQRQRLWASMVPAGRLEPGGDLRGLAAAHELSGGAIANVVRHAAVCAVRRGDARMRFADLQRGVARERHKEGRSA